MSASLSPQSSERSPYILGVENSVRGRSWCSRLEDERAALTLAQGLDIPEILGRVLAGRHIGLEDAQTYLDPSLKALLPDPSCFLDMDKAAIRIAKAIREEEPLAIFGDYDVDGATSSALLIRFFKALGQEPHLYIPDRAREGYGPNAQAFETLAEAGAKVIITVDCGTMAYEPLARAKALSLDVVVVDHHQAEEKLPEATALVNPNRLDDLSGYGQLAAVGVVFLLVVAINRQLRKEGWYDEAGVTPPDLLQLLDIVALGTVCDVVPLTGVNRAFVTQGLKIMNGRRNLGIATLADIAKINGDFGTYECGFILGPRVNAGGRVGRSDLGSRLLTTEDLSLASTIALDLDHMNKERRTLEADVLEQAMAQAERLMSESSSKPPVLIVASEGWHEGVIGIVASRLKDHFGVPSIVISLSDAGTGKGSGRSIPGVDLGKAIVAALSAGLLVSGGGHAMAAGLSLARGALDGLKEFLSKHLKPQVEKAMKEATAQLDGILTVQGATAELCHLLEKAGPYGAGNPEPVFAFPDLQVVHSKIVGDAHISCVFAGAGGAKLRGIAFRSAGQPLGELLLSRREKIHISGRLRPDTWRGGDAVQLMVNDAAIPALGH